MLARGGTSNERKVSTMKLSVIGWDDDGGRWSSARWIASIERKAQGRVAEITGASGGRGTELPLSSDRKVTPAERIAAEIEQERFQRQMSAGYDGRARVECGPSGGIQLQRRSGEGGAVSVATARGEAVGDFT